MWEHFHYCKSSIKPPLFLPLPLFQPLSLIGLPVFKKKFEISPLSLGPSHFHNKKGFKSFSDVINSDIEIITIFCVCFLEFRISPPIQQVFSSLSPGVEQIFYLLGIVGKFENNICEHIKINEPTGIVKNH